MELDGQSRGAVQTLRGLPSGSRMEVRLTLPELLLANDPSTAPNDQDLMERIARGDVHALELLYDRYSAAILSVCIRLIGDREEAEDVLMEILWEVWQRSDRYDRRRGKPLAYLMTLTRSRALDRARYRRRRSGVWGDSADERAFNPTQEHPDSPDRSLLSAERREQIRKGLGELSEAQRAAVELSFFDGLSHAEIAERLGEPLGTVKTRIRQGLIRLRETLRVVIEGKHEA